MHREKTNGYHSAITYNLYFLFFFIALSTQASIPPRGFQIPPRRSRVHNHKRPQQRHINWRSAKGSWMKSRSKLYLKYAYFNNSAIFLKEDRLLDFHALCANDRIFASSIVCTTCLWCNILLFYTQKYLQLS